MVGAGKFGNVGQVRRKIKLVEHHDGLNDVLVDFKAVFRGQGAFADAQVVEFTQVVLIGGDIHLESMGIVAEGIWIGSGNDVFRLIGQNRFHHRQIRRRMAIFEGGLILGYAQAIVQMADPGARGDLLQSRDFLVGHKLAADVALGNEGEIRLDQGERIGQFGLQGGIIDLAGQALAIGRDLGIAQQHLETRSDFVDTVVKGFQFGGLVNHVFRCGHLAAVVQPGGHFEFPALVLGGHLEIGERTTVSLVGGGGEHFGHHRHARAVPAGVMGFGVNGTGDQFGEVVEQLALLFQQPPDFGLHEKEGLDERVDLLDTGVEGGRFGKVRALDF